MTASRGGWRLLATLFALSAVGVAVAGLAARRFMRFEVSGASMEPAFCGGDWLIVDRAAFRGRAPRAGEVVVVRDPEVATRWLVKRVWRVDADGWLDVRGDNTAESRDSRAFGLVGVLEVEGRVRWRYWRGRRPGA